jgi:cyanophycin synthetase
VAYFSLDEESPFIKSAEGKIVAVYENGFITIKKGEWKIRIERATHVPLTLGGKAKFMIANVLAATLASYVWDSKRKILACYKLSFQALLKHRTNEYFEFKKFKVLIDFAHNASGYKVLRSTYKV